MRKFLLFRSIVLALLLFTTTIIAQIPRKVTFAGHIWDVRKGNNQGPGPNDWSNLPRQVWVDPDGRLHLAVRPTEKKWSAVGVYRNNTPKQQLGYGDYRWVIRGNFHAFEPQVVLGLFLWEDLKPDAKPGTTPNELDFELSRFGNPLDPSNGQFAVCPQSKTLENNLKRFLLPKANLITIRLQWKPERVIWQVYEGAKLDFDNEKRLVEKWEYSGKGKVPVPNVDTKVHMNLWIYSPQGQPFAIPSKEHEVIIESFHFIP